MGRQIIENLPKIEDWLDENFKRKNKLMNWNEAIKRLHNSDDSKNKKSSY